MKVLLINGSPREKGNTASALKEVANLFRHSPEASFILKWLAISLLLLLAVPAVLANAMTYCHILPQIISGYLFSRFDTVFAGGAFDQGGLTKPAMSIFMMEVFAALGYSLSVRISRPQWWRIACIMTCLAAFVAPVALTVHYSWELTRYIAVMGITPSRIMGVRFAILFLFVPLACLAGCFVGAKSIKRVAITAGICLLVAYMMFRAVDTAARKSISCHPRPKRCMPNMIWVPDTPDASPDYGLKEILLY